MKKPLIHRITALLLILFVATLSCFALVGCGNQSDDGDKDDGQKINMTESYSKGRQEFYAVTGVELPALENLVVEEFPYEEGATSYELDITDGATQDTFDTLVTFLDTALTSWTKEGPTTDGDYTNIWYEKASDRIGITWDEHNTAVYVHAIMNGNN